MPVHLCFWTAVDVNILLFRVSMQPKLVGYVVSTCNPFTESFSSRACMGAAPPPPHPPPCFVVLILLFSSSFFVIQPASRRVACKPSIEKNRGEVVCCCRRRWGSDTREALRSCELEALRGGKMKVNLWKKWPERQGSAAHLPDRHIQQRSRETAPVNKCWWALISQRLAWEVTISVLMRGTCSAPLFMPLWLQPPIPAFAPWPFADKCCFPHSRLYIYLQQFVFNILTPNCVCQDETPPIPLYKSIFTASQ